MLSKIIGLIKANPQPPSNKLQGLLGVADATWGVAPNGLANVTDGNRDTYSGTGTKTVSGAGNLGYITFDLGSVKTILVGGKFGIWSTANGITCFLQVSNTDSNYRTTATLINGSTNTSEAVIEATPAIVTTRYLKLRFYASGAMDANVKLYELGAWDLGS